MTYCGICGRHHDSATPCAVANRSSVGKVSRGRGEGRKLAKRVDWILAAAAIAALALMSILAAQ